MKTEPTNFYLLNSDARCPSCNHFNAMLSSLYEGDRYIPDRHKCRDCGFVAIAVMSTDLLGCTTCGVIQSGINPGCYRSHCESCGTGSLRRLDRNCFACGEKLDLDDPINFEMRKGGHVICGCSTIGVTEELLIANGAGPIGPISNSAAIDQLENGGRLQRLVDRKDAARKFVADALPDVPIVALDRIFDVLLTNDEVADNFDRYIRTVKTIDREFA